MISAAETTLRLLWELERQSTSSAAVGNVAASPAPPQTVEVSAAAMLQALIDTDFNLSAAIVRVRVDA